MGSWVRAFVRAYALVFGLTVAGCGPAERPVAKRTHVGGAVCAGCHEDQASRWTGSHHELAMQAANEETVLGDFEDARYDGSGGTGRFYRRDGGFFVETEGEDGELAEFEVAYTFGADPLQQYLIAFPDGRYQPLSIAWDSRPTSDGGQRWFHLYPDAPPPPGDPIHWTGRIQTWNFQCAECHSTNLVRGYEPDTDRYQTTWSDINVACEACHGPGSEHVRWAESAGVDARLEPGSADGHILGLTDTDGGAWVFPAGETIASRTMARSSQAEIETCARCHSRRGPLADETVHGEPILQTHRVSLLEEGLYHADGQILDEVYVYGSFLQSRMHRAGVTCTDCHDPHTAELRAEGNALCARCHLPTAYDTPEHHLHPVQSPGSSCVECHMPETTYMVVDPRRDHSLRVPRPSLTDEIGVPNACTNCHTDRPPAWANSVLTERFGVNTEASFALVLDAARRGDARIAPDLGAMVEDTTQAAIVRATAAALLGRFQGNEVHRAIRTGLSDPSPLVRMGTLRSLEGTALEAQWRNAMPLLDDPIRAVRLEAARRLVAAPRAPLSIEEAEAIDRAIETLVSSELVNAERPEAHLNVATLRVQRGRLADARASLETALRLDPTFVPAYLNLSDVLRAAGIESQSEAVLRQGLEMAPDEASLHHGLGLALVRTGRLPEALEALRRATELAPENGRFGYVYGVALNSDDSTAAIAELERALEFSPFDYDILFGLVTFTRDANRLGEAVSYAERLVASWPDDLPAQQLLLRLREAEGR